MLNLIKCVNPTPELTGSESKTSHRDVDRSNGPDNQQPKIGWKTVPVCKKLGAVNRRSMGLASSVRVQVRACSNTLAGKATGRNTVLHRGAGKDFDELLAKGAIREAMLSAESFVS